MMKTHSAAFVCLALALLALLMERQMVACNKHGKAAGSHAIVARDASAPCGEHQHPVTCVNCPRTCTSPIPKPCAFICTPGCQCDAGYIFLNDEKTECVPENQCP
ncbi:chymotrypsin/elastase isoinhibitors 2 to 5-like [Rhinatrema bivittatum]|uniref:chymotrypsin/elastase isoinhibitors 2 to 5-like n=1 Tax=Rhinatrema bivittatum TaxID=194408 RepID=UPI00112736DC|nr:chymotrypsin/elastase isoinhibitors 2 to 5-like [Rhinatrema bivittatum]